MFSLYKTVHPPTGIDNSVYCNFRNPNENNLITSSSNRLNIYKFYSCDSLLKLELIESYYLYGTISSVKSCRYGNMNKDALIIAFIDAKLSIVEYDENIQDLITLSIHYFEDEIETEGLHYNIYEPILKVDPNMRCACMLIYGFKLVVIPFHSSQDAGENSEDTETNSKSLSSYTIDLRKLDNWLEMRIIDIEFLYGYYEPTLFVLCESNMTWVGRYAVKKDTCNSVALSLNLNQRTHPIIWPVDKLPSDCLKSYAVPDPIGGVLIFAVNSLIYINQSVPSHAVSLNSIAKQTSHYPFKTHLEHVKITLDSSQALFISHDKVCVSLKGGELYIITLLTDTESLRSIRSFNIDKCANSVISTGLTKCYDNYLFVGSRLGNSVLLKYNEDVVEMETETTVNYTFEICDVLLNIAPCGNSIIGQSNGDLNEYLTEIDSQNSLHLNHIDVITSSGYTKNGGISILQRSIRPDLIASFQISDIIDLWSVNLLDTDPYSVSYLFLTRLDSSLVLQIGSEITEIESPVFSKDPTVYVSNLQGNKFIIQVTTREILIYGKEIDVYIVDSLKHGIDYIKQCYILDPYIGILSEIGQLSLYRYDTKLRQIDLEIGSINCFSLFEDTVNVLINIEPVTVEMKEDEKKTFFSDPYPSHVDDEDELLYGNSGVDARSSTNDYINRLLTEKNPNAVVQTQVSSQKPSATLRPTNPTFWLFIITDGNLEMINLDSLKPEYVYPRFNNSLKCLTVTESSKNCNSTVHELLVVPWGVDNTRPLIVSRIDEDLIIYEFMNQNLKKVNHEILIRDKKKKKFFDRNEGERGKLVPCLRRFDSLGSFNGFAVIGSSLSSYLVFNTPRCGLTPHPLWKDTSFPLLSFTQFKNSSITMSGFIYSNKNSDIRICSLPYEDSKLNYDFPWVLKKVSIRQTVNFVSYHEESKTYAVCYNQQEATGKLMQLGEEDKEIVEFQKEENFIYPNKSQYYVQLYTPVEWEPLPYGKFQLGEWEHVSCMKIVELPYEGHSSGLRSYLAVSTIYCYSEDVNSRGRIIIFDIIETVPEPDKPLTNTKLKSIYEKEQKGPVTCLESVNSNLIGCVGQKVFIWEFKNNELIGKAFIDCSFYVHKMITLKNFVLIADLHKSISLVRFQSDYAKLSFVAKDKHFLDIYSCEYFVDNTNLGFIASDSEKNLSIYAYQSESHDNQGGTWLIKKAEFNVGSKINSMFRLKCKVNDPSMDKRAGMAEKRQVTYCTNLDGGIGFVLPISSKTFLRLFMLQNAIIVMKSHYAGLNPKSYRMYKGKRKELSNFQKNVLDGDLLFEYFNMSYPERNEISKKIKATTEQLLDDLTEVFQLTCHF